MRPLGARGLIAVAALLVSGASSPDAGYGAPLQETAGGTTLSDAELDDLTARVASELRCPVCRNQAVIESSAELSREMQALIRERLARGDTPEQVKAYFVARYGEWILLKPEARGVNLLVYVLPVLTFLVGGLVVWRLLKRWSGDPAGRLAAAKAGSSADPGDAATPAEQRASNDACPSVAGESASGLSERDEAWLETVVSER